MPFERYLHDDGGDGKSAEYSDQTYNNGDIARHDVDSSAFSTNLEFHMPQFMLSGPPTLAQGGGAEVLPVGMFNNPGNPWFSNNGFSTKSYEGGNFPPSLASSSYKQYNSTIEVQEDLPWHRSPPSAPFDSRSNSQDLYSNTAETTRDEYAVQSVAQAVRTTEGGGPLHMSLLNHDLISLTNKGVQAPSPLGLPIYSASGFDLLSILARVATRPHPKIALGPVDLTCAFVVVDVRRFDHPIVYCSPTFCELTGYSEAEVLGRNCRFLQAPDGNVKKGDQRQFVTPETVQHMYKCVTADKECQASIVNYRKGGQAFINLVTVIPVLGGLLNRPDEADEVIYQVGFQVDLSEQPNVILQKLRDGSYLINSGNQITPTFNTPVNRKSNPSNAVSKDLRTLLADSAFLKSLPVSKAATVSPSSAVEKAENSHDGSALSLILLENSPDFIHVLSLKGSFLYVAPSVRRVLGYEPEELVGKSIADYCHPADLVPLMRELKESSITHGVSNDGQGLPTVQAGPSPPKTVDLLFRARSKSMGYVWIECRGRLHVEPGKGRKAIILSGRFRGMPSLEWSTVVGAGGLMPAVRNHEKKLEGRPKDKEREFWGMLSSHGTFLVAGAAIRDVLGWGVGEIIGQGLLSLVVDGSGKQVLGEHLARRGDEVEPVKVICEMDDKEGHRLTVQVVLYRDLTSTISPSPLICQVMDLHSTPQMMSQAFSHSHTANVFEELDTERGSSWQYELQQLKFANQRLLDEVDTLEASVLTEQQRTVSQQFTDPFMSDQNPVHGISVARHMRFETNDWSTPILREYDMQRPLKRSWDHISTS